MQIDIQDLLDALMNYAEDCRESGLQPTVQILVQPRHSIKGSLSGFTVTESGAFVLAARSLQDYGTQEDDVAFEGPNY